MADSNNVVISFVGDTTQLDNSVKEFTADIQKAGQVSATAFTAFNKQNQEAVVSTKAVTTNLQDLNKVVATGAINEYSKEIAEVTVKHVSLRGQVMAAKQALYEMAEQGKKGTQAWIDQKAALEKAATALREMNKLTANLGSQTKVFAGLMDAARGVAAGFEVAKSASILFGASQKDAEETLKKLIPIMATLQGLQEIQLLLKEDSAAMQLVLNGQEAAGVAIKQLQTAAESENIIVSKAATAAQWALNAAMEANPIMLLVGAIGAVVAAFLYFTSATKEADEETIKFNEDIGKVNDSIQKGYIKRLELLGQLNEADAKSIEINTDASKKSLEVLNEYEKKRKDLIAKRPIGDSAISANEAKIKEVGEQETKLLESIEMDRQLKLSNLKTEFLTSEQEKESDRLNKIKHLQEAASKAALAADKKYYDDLLKQSDIEWDALKQERDDRYAQQIADAKGNFEALSKIKSNHADELQFEEDFYNHSLEIEKAFNSMSFEDFQEWEKKKRKEYKETEDEAKRLMNEQIKEEEKFQAEKEAAIRQGAQAAIKIAQTVADAIFTIEKNNRDAALAADLSALDQKKDHELSNKHLTSAQIDAINKKYARIEAAAKLKAWKADQDAAATQAGIKMALGVVNAWATSSSWVQALIVTAAVIAAGAAEIAVIKSQKPPQFAGGTEYVGLNGAPSGRDTVHAMLDEGERVVPTHINKQLKGIANEDLPKLMEAYYPPMPHAPELSALHTVVVAPVIDYDKLGTIIAQKLKDNPQTHINIDKGGFSVHISEKQRYSEKLNNRYAS